MIAILWQKSFIFWTPLARKHIMCHKELRWWLWLGWERPSWRKEIFQLLARHHSTDCTVALWDVDNNYWDWGMLILNALTSVVAEKCFATILVNILFDSSFTSFPLSSSSIFILSLGRDIVRFLREIPSFPPLVKNQWPFSA